MKGEIIKRKLDKHIIKLICEIIWEDIGEMKSSSRLNEKFWQDLIKNKPIRVAQIKMTLNVAKYSIIIYKV